MKINSATEMINLGEKIGRQLKAPAVLELTGDVGAGKTTFTKGVAKALGIKQEITSPSFTISKRYKTADGELIHYDFYRLDDPGLMVAELEEALDGNNIVILEWANSVLGILPEKTIRINFQILGENEREIKIEGMEL
mgnify:CR=1 FL=1